MADILNVGDKITITGWVVSGLDKHGRIGVQFEGQGEAYCGGIDPAACTLVSEPAGAAPESPVAAPVASRSALAPPVIVAPPPAPVPAEKPAQDASDSAA